MDNSSTTSSSRAVPHREKEHEKKLKSLEKHYETAAMRQFLPPSAHIGPTADMGAAGRPSIVMKHL